MTQKKRCDTGQTEIYVGKCLVSQKVGTSSLWKFLLFTTRKRSLKQGNVFTGVCLSTGGGGRLRRMQYRSHDLGGLPMGGSVSSGSASGRGPASRGRVEQTPLDLPTEGLHPAGCRVHEILRGYGQQAGGTHPTGMLSF